MSAKAPFIRARKPDEKEARRTAIMRAARALALEAGPYALSLNELGRRSGVSKPNIYRYFEGREEVLLRLFLVELDAAVAALEAETARIAPVTGGGAALGVVARAFARVYVARPLFCQLVGMLASVIEHNLSVDVIVEAKREMLVLGARAAAALQRGLPWLSSSDASWATSTVTLHVAALWPAAHPSAAAAEVLGRSEFAVLKPDAARDLEHLVHVLLRGLAAGTG